VDHREYESMHAATKTACSNKNCMQQQRHVSVYENFFVGF